MNKLHIIDTSKVITISENREELRQRFNVSYTTANEGHNNNSDEATAILDKLKQLGKITAQQYKRYKLSCLKNRNRNNSNNNSLTV